MIELLVNNQPVDLGEDFTVKITKTIADIREPENRQSDYSKTFTLPGTKNNHRIFSHLFELGHVNGTTGSTNFAPDFNPNLKADARLLIDGVEQLAGFLRLLDIQVTDGQQIVYQCSLHGQMADLFANIGNKKLSELDFSKFNHDLTRTNVINSWDTSYALNGGTASFAYGSGYVHLLADKGYKSSRRIWALEEVTPAIFAKEIVDAIFSDSGYSYSTDSFFNDVTFKRLVVPVPGDGLRMSDAQRVLKSCFAGRTTTQSVTYGTNFVATDDSTGDFDDPSNAYNTTTGVFTAQYGGTYQVVLSGSLTITDVGAAIGASDRVAVELGVYINGALVSTFYQDCGLYGLGPVTANISTGYLGPYKLLTGDEITVQLEAVYTGTTFPVRSGTVIAGSGFSATLGSNYTIAVGAMPGSWSYNEEIDFSTFFAGDYLQRDFIKGLIHMFNLYAEPDKDNPKKLVIKPYNSFFGSTVRDWSAKLDYSQPLKIEPMGELDANPYRFTYKEDKDVANQDYSGGFGGVYGDKVVKIDNDFVRNEKKIELPFAATLYSTEDGMTLPWIEYGDGKQTGSGLRILYYGGLLNCPAWALTDYEITGIISTPPGATTLTAYPYAGHLDNPTTSTLDLLFAMPHEVNLSAGVTYTNANLYNTYWRKYINEITDRDSKVVSGYFRITPADIQKLSFQDLFFFEGQYFRLNKIEDYDCEEDNVTLCEFVKTKSYPVHVPLTKRLPGGWDTTDSDGNVYPVLKVPQVYGGNIGPRLGGMYGTTNDSGTKDALVVGNKNKISGDAQAVAVLGGNNVRVLPVDRSVVLMGDDIQVTQSDSLYIGKFLGNLQWLVGGTGITHTSGDSLTLSTYATDYIWPDYVNVDTSAVADNVVVRLPDPANIEGRQVVIRNDDGAHIVSIVKEDDTSFDGSVSHTLTEAGASMTWRVVDGEWRRYDSKVTDGGTF